MQIPVLQLFWGVDKIRIECKFQFVIKFGMEYDKRVKQKYRIGKCKICETNNIKLLGDVCKSCTNGLKGFGYDIDTLKKAVVYLEKY